MKREQVELELQAIVDRVEDQDDVWREIERLPDDLKMRMVHQLKSVDFHESIKAAGAGFIDFCEATELLNDYKQRRFKREQALGMLLALSAVYLQSSESNGRAELQAMNEHTVFASKITDAINDRAIELRDIVDELITLDCEYFAILEGRMMGVHFTDDEGSHAPFSEEETQRFMDRRRERQADVEQWRSKERKRVELIYSGRIAPPPLEEEEQSRQLSVPLWV